MGTRRSQGLGRSDWDKGSHKRSRSMGSLGGLPGRCGIGFLDLTLLFSFGLEPSFAACYGGRGNHTALNGPHVVQAAFCRTNDTSVAALTGADQSWFNPHATAAGAWQELLKLPVILVLGVRSS